MKHLTVHVTLVRRYIIVLIALCIIHAILFILIFMPRSGCPMHSVILPARPPMRPRRITVAPPQPAISINRPALKHFVAMKSAAASLSNSSLSPFSQQATVATSSPQTVSAQQQPPDNKSIDIKTVPEQSASSPIATPTVTAQKISIASQQSDDCKQAVHSPYSQTTASVQSPSQQLSHYFNTRNQRAAQARNTLASMSKGVLAKVSNDMTRKDLVTIKTPLEGIPSELQNLYAQYVHQLEQHFANTLPHVQKNSPRIFSPLSKYTRIDLTLQRDGSLKDIVLRSSSGDSALDAFYITWVSYSTKFFPPVPEPIAMLFGEFLTIPYEIVNR